MGISKTVLFERDEHIYLVAPVGPINPTDEEVAAFSGGAFDSKAFAPNGKIGWLRGQLVEAERPNLNGAFWSADELAIASVTPRLMPVTVMHDFKQNVGVIADVRLLTPDADQVPRARIDDTLAIWRHRAPAVWDEITANYDSGDLMQSMECIPEHYDCGDCGMRFLKLPNNAEQANWCEHLRGESAVAENGGPVRRLGNVTFTGTGLIFGTRGARGAYDDAHLDVLQDEVAEFHERSKHPQAHRPKPKRRTNLMEVDDTKYAELVAAEARLREVEPKLTAAEELAAQVPTLTSENERLEVEKKAAEDLAAAEKKRADELAEADRASTLSKDRLGKLGEGFKAKLPEKLTAKLEEQAKSLSDDDWTERLDEVAELVGVKHDADAPEGDGADLGDVEEIASAGGSGGTGGTPASGTRTQDQKRRQTVAGLMKVV